MWKKLFIVAALFGTTVFAERESKTPFSIFNVVTFENKECNIDGLGSLLGTCYTAQECDELNGENYGPCASGFGICCLFSYDCGGVVSQNGSYIKGNETITQIQEPRSNVCEFYMQTNERICSLRLDFEQFNILAGTGSTDPDSECQDTFRVTNMVSGNNRLPTICGFNTGDHIYIDVGPEVNNITGFSATLEFNLAEKTDSRNFNIRITQHECFSDLTPPPGCLQYFMAKRGRITSFNFNRESESQNSMGAHLDKQDYFICIRQEEDHCCTEYAVCDEPNSFTLDNSRYELFAETHVGRDEDLQDLRALASSTCTRDFIEIEGSSEQCEGGTISSRYCGFRFGTEIASDTDEDFAINEPLENILARPHKTICDCSLPFQVGIRTNNENTRGVPRANVMGQPLDIEEASVQARGVCLDFIQKPCV